mgnify:FL=1|tara:strand:- start:3719 stop:4090 length:372 start_codon:yes stop_codon:yes gene_type:complete
MALERGKLSDVVQVAAGATVDMITVASNKKVYIKSIICHASGTGIGTGTAQVYFCPIGNGGVGAALTTKIFDVDINSGETVLLEPSYPLVLDTTGDKLMVGTGNVAGVAATHINFLITGDKEA